MPTIAIGFPTTCRDAILLVRYLRAWSNAELAAAIGIKSGSQFSRIINHHTPGTDAMRDRVLACMPDTIKPKTITWPEERPQRIPDYTMGVGSGW